jgi:hypothetical protein
MRLPDVDVLLGELEGKSHEERLHPMIDVGRRGGGCKSRRDDSGVARWRSNLR